MAETLLHQWCANNDAAPTELLAHLWIAAVLLLVNGIMRCQRNACDTPACRQYAYNEPQYSPVINRAQKAMLSTIVSALIMLAKIARTAFLAGHHTVVY